MVKIEIKDAEGNYVYRREAESESINRCKEQLLDRVNNFDTNIESYLSMLLLECYIFANEMQEGRYGLTFTDTGEVIKFTVRFPSTSEYLTDIRM